MKKFIKVLLSLNSLRKIIGYSQFKKSFEHNYHIELNTDLSHVKKAMVFAPHPDDEVFGMGGTLIKLIQQGVEITVLYFCDGAGGSLEKIKLTSDQKKRLVKTRRDEAESLKSILGFKEQIFFGYSDGNLSESPASVKIVSGLIEKAKPDIIFLPSFLENHPDHKAVNDILMKVMNKVDFSQIDIWAYEVWTTLFPNRIMKINDVFEAKQDAMMVYKSQIGTRGYQNAILGLNEYRAEINNLEGYAEAFFAAKPEIYKEMYKITR